MGQALREDAQEVRHELDDSGSDEDRARGTTMAVSGRGAKILSSTTLPQQEPAEDFRPIALHQLVQPQDQEAMPPPVHQKSHMYQAAIRGLGPKAAISGAAAAMINAPEDDADEAFGRQFHLAEIHATETSMISGLSGTSDAMSGLTGEGGSKRPTHASRHNQLMQLRQQWASQNNVSLTSDSIPSRSSNVSGLSPTYPNIQRSHSFQSASDNMSWVDNNSLRGGGIRESLYSTGMTSHTMGSSLFGGGSQFASSQLGSPYGGQPLPYGTTGSFRGNSGMSVASMSMQSLGLDSMPSIPGSIMSDMSDTLAALDLAEPKFEGV